MPSVFRNYCEIILFLRAKENLESPFKASSLKAQARYILAMRKAPQVGGWLLIIHKVIVRDRLCAMPKRPKVKSSSLTGKKIQM